MAFSVPLPTLYWSQDFVFSRNLAVFAMLSREDRFSRHVFVQSEKLCFHQKTKLQIRAKPHEHLRSANLSRTLVGICMIVSYSNTNVCMKHTTQKDYHLQKKYDCPQTTINFICQNKLRLTFLLTRTVLTHSFEPTSQQDRTRKNPKIEMQFLVFITFFSLCFQTRGLIRSFSAFFQCRVLHCSHWHDQPSLVVCCAVPSSSLWSPSPAHVTHTAEFVELLHKSGSNQSTSWKNTHGPEEKI